MHVYLMSGISSYEWKIGKSLYEIKLINGPAITIRITSSWKPVASDISSAWMQFPEGELLLKCLAMQYAWGGIHKIHVISTNYIIRCISHLSAVVTVWPNVMVRQTFWRASAHYSDNRAPFWHSACVRWIRSLGRLQIESSMEFDVRILGEFRIKEDILFIWNHAEWGWANAETATRR